jgi:hypothetical protein
MSEMNENWLRQIEASPATTNERKLCKLIRELLPKKKLLREFDRCTVCCKSFEYIKKQGPRQKQCSIRCQNAIYRLAMRKQRRKGLRCEWYGPCRNKVRTLISWEVPGRSIKNAPFCNKHTQYHAFFLQQDKIPFTLAEVES